MKPIRFLSSMILLTILSACGGEIPEDISIENDLVIPDSGFEFKLNQRKQQIIPSICGGVYCEIDDITGDECNMMIVADSVLLLKQTIHEKDTLNFEYKHKNYRITCIVLMNQLIGDDHGIFMIFNPEKLKPKVVKDIESEKIEQLLGKIEASNVIFIRNGLEYKGKAAADHLRDKWEQEKNQIKTYDDFIIYIASKSSISGKAYQVKSANDSLVLATDWYREQMQNIPLN